MKPIYLFFLAFSILSCKSEESTIFEFDPRNFSDSKFSLSEIAEDIKYIPLDDSNPIGMYYQYELVNNLIYISVKDVGIITFKQGGEFFKKIGNIGRGPGEYRFFMNFTVDEINGNIYVMDLNIIKVYSKNGKFLRNISLTETGGYFNEINYFDSKLFIPEYIQVGKAKYNWIIIDTLGSVISKKNNFIPEFSSTFMFMGGTYKFENKISYWNIYDDTVYSILPDLSYSTSFLFSKGNHRHPRLRVNDNSTLKNVFHPSYIFETSQFLFLIYHFKGKSIVLIDKKDQKSLMTYLDTEFGGIMNDIDGGISFQPKGYVIEKGKEYLTGIVYPNVLKAYVKGSEFKNYSPKYPEKKKELKRLADSLDETDNPVLMMVRLKK